MTPTTKRPASVAEYIAATPKESRPKVRQMRACIRAAAPGAKESLKWGMPSYSYQRIIVIFAAHKHHIGFYPMPSAVKAFKKDLVKFKTAKGSVQFPLERPLPLPLIRRITAFRVRETMKGKGTWKS